MKRKVVLAHDSGLGHKISMGMGYFKKTMKVGFWILGLVGVFLAFAPASVKAGVSLLDKGGFKADLSLEMAAGVFAIQNAHWGDPEENKGYADGYIKPVVNVSYDLGNAGSLYGGLSYAASFSYGDDGGWGMWEGDTEEIESEQAYIGWKSGTLFSSLGRDFLDISLGEQEFQIGDGFLLYDGESDGRYGAFWTAPHKSFDFSAIVRLNARPVRADLFYLETDKDKDNTDLYGVNIEYINETLGTVGATWMLISDVDKDGSGGYGSRDGMNVYSIRGQGSPLASLGLENLFLSFEYALETDGDRVEKDADAWYAEAGYTLTSLPWTPTLTYRYASFSGDEAGTSDDEAWDPLFYGAGRGWGTWFMGEIVGEYYLGNSNQNTHMVKLDMHPTDKLTIGCIYYDFSLDEEAGFGDDYGDEINVCADYAVNDNFSISAVFGHASPDDAWEAGGGKFEDVKLFEIAAFLYF